MDKRKVISAYRRGDITIQECAQIIGLEGRQMKELMKVWTRSMDAGLAATAARRDVLQPHQ
ncbi:hypothetical protein [Paenibacillus oryzae]|uniref:hypothetical protein n=1 Tax=Paenibacillus oryzae TaxID=1844972 RepID=UPI0009ECC7AE|nr:hypothetical protein [Paenibacillus oryzae]